MGRLVQSGIYTKELSKKDIWEMSNRQPRDVRSYIEKFGEPKQTVRMRIGCWNVEIHIHGEGVYPYLFVEGTHRSVDDKRFGYIAQAIRQWWDFGGYGSLTVAEYLQKILEGRDVRESTPTQDSGQEESK
jgi:hypothetical protein